MTDHRGDRETSPWARHDDELTQHISLPEPTVAIPSEPTLVLDDWPAPGQGQLGFDPTPRPSGPQRAAAPAPSPGPGPAEPAGWSPPVHPPQPAYGWYGPGHDLTQYVSPQQPAYPQAYPVTQAPQRPRARVLPALVASALVAALIGAGAGYAGARYADRTGAGVAPLAPASSSAPIPPAVGKADTVAVAERVLPSTVTIAYSSAGKSGTGSGFVIDEQGHVMTNNHVVEGAVSGRLMVQLQDGSRRDAEIVGRSPGYDLAVIKVSDAKGLPKVDLGDSADVKPGQPIVAVGAPLGLGGTVTAGIVSAVDRPLSVGGNEQGTDDRVAYINGIQIDAPINPGNSGGPLSDGAGRIIGVNSAILTLGGATQDTQGNIGLGFAIPINQAVDVANELITKGRASYPVMGASIAPDQVGAGVRLTAVSSGGPAGAAGLRVGDVIETVDGRIVRTPTELIVRIRAHRPGDAVKLGVSGRGDVSVTLAGKEG